MRSHLRDAHQRVIAVAELERQLAASSFEEVEGAPAMVAANVSISLGLIGRGGH